MVPDYSSIYVLSFLSEDKSECNRRTTFKKHHNHLLDAALIVKAMIQTRREMEDDDRRAKELNLTDDELTLRCRGNELRDDLRADFLRNLIHDVVQTIKRNLKVVQTLLGHKGLRMTIRYSHLSPEHLAGAVKAPDGVFTREVGMREQSARG